VGGQYLKVATDCDTLNVEALADVSVEKLKCVDIVRCDGGWLYQQDKWAPIAQSEKQEFDARYDDVVGRTNRGSGSG
tara:strand:+ start:686 stop:916 length:231 start_codon:yes stop_codon:yes gene_type:complete